MGLRQRSRRDGEKKMANGKMPNIKVVNLGGKEVGTFELDEIFAGEVNEALLWEW